MYSTKFGTFDGDSWEQLMQICFRLKYESEHYQPIPASPGDCGLEGFTKSGKAFQCYCPDNNLTSQSLYEKQRDKITKDLNKLSTFKDRIALFLSDTVIKEWIFVTPDYRDNELIIHCNNKRSDVLSWNLPFISKDFQVVVHDIDNFIKQIPIAKGTAEKLLISPKIRTHNEIIQWKQQEIDLVGNAIRKHSKRFPDSTKGTNDKINKLTEATIKSYFDRESILGMWQRLHPEDYDRFLKLISQIESEVEEQCMFPTENNNELYISLRTVVRARLKESFNYLDEITLESLTHGAIADWLLRCPLDFE